MNISIDRSFVEDVQIHAVVKGGLLPFRLEEKLKENGVLTWHYARSEEEVEVLAVGLGERHSMSTETLRKAGASAVRAVIAQGRSRASLIRQHRDKSGTSNEGSISSQEELQAWIEGWLYGAYRFNNHRGITANHQTALLNIRPDDWPELSKTQIEDAVVQAEIRAEAVNFTRDLVNETPDVLNPEAFAEALKARFKGTPVKVHVYQGAELLEKQMNGLVAVGAGSRYSPALIEMMYEGAAPDEAPLIALVGKGITFDMGGMNVKTGRDISDARMDMGGAAAAAGAMEILVRRKSPVRAAALIAIAENVSGSHAIRPSSVIQYPNGLTVQVANTDGEGRLILADALIHAERLGAVQAIDIATLTGNIGDALGLEMAGVWGDKDIQRELVEIGERNGERLWPMPLIESYLSELKSDYADLRNVGVSTLAGAITAALFIRHFAADSMKWAHIDMAGTVQYKRDYPFAEAGATGYGTRLLADYVENISASWGMDQKEGN